MNDLPGTQQPYHVIQLRIPVLSRGGKAFFGILAGVAALALATWAGWSGHAHHIAATNPTSETATPVSVSAPAPELTPVFNTDLPRAQTPVAIPREETTTKTTIYGVQPTAPAPVTAAQPSVAVNPPAAPVASTPKATPEQIMNDAIENQAAATGQTPAQVIQSLNPGNPPPAPSSSVAVAAPATQTVVVPAPVTYVYPYPYYYGGYYPSAYYGGYGYPYYGRTSLSLYFGSHGRIGGGVGFHR